MYTLGFFQTPVYFTPVYTALSDENNPFFIIPETTSCPDNPDYIFWTDNENQRITRHLRYIITN